MRTFASLLLAVLSGTVACTGGGAAGSGRDAGNSSLEDATAGDERIEAMRRTADGNALCTKLGDFYWSVGDASGRIGEGQVGASVAGDTRMAIFSASKLLFASYVVERMLGELDDALIAGLNFTSGYAEPGLRLCTPTDTVGSCFENELDVFAPEKVGSFHYASGHMQRIAALPEHLGLFELDRQGFADEIMSELGYELELEFKVDVTIAGMLFTAGPLAAGGMHTSARAYEKFLVKLVEGGLQMADHLGAEAVPTGIPTIDYSLGHWVEKTADGTIDAYSSVGALGFYPWVDGTKEFWGILARLETDETKTAAAATDSQLCGAQMRRAFFLGQAQL